MNNTLHAVLPRLRAVTLLLLASLCYASTYAQMSVIETTDAQPCLGDVVTYNLEPVPGGAIAWELADPLLGNVFVNANGEAVIDFFASGTTELTATFGGSAATLQITVAPEVNALITSETGYDCPETSGGSSGLVHCFPDQSDVFTASPDGDVVWSTTGPITLSATTGQSVTGLYTGLGAFTVRATVTTAAGCSDEYIYTGFIEDVPNYNITNSVYDADQTIQICRNESLSFGVDLPIDDNTLVWSVNGVTIIGNVLDYEFTVAGQHTIELLVRTPCLCEQVVDMATVVVEEGPRYEVLCQEVACADSTLTYNLDLDNGAGAICPDVTWSAINGMVSSTTGDEITVTWDDVDMTTTGQLILTPPAGCTGCIQPTVIEVPIIGSTAEINVDPTCIDDFQSTSAITHAIPGAIYQWSYSDISPSYTSTNHLAGARFNFGAQSVTGTIGVIITYPLGGCESTGSVEVNRIPRFMVSDAPICVGDEISITYSGSSAADYTATYQLGNATGTLNFNDQSPITIPATQAGLLTLEISDYTYTDPTTGDVTTLQTCEDDFQILVNRTDAPTDIDGPVEVCPNTVSTYVVEPITSSYTWEVTGGTFVSSGTTTATGAQVNVEWGNSPPYQLEVRRVDAGCESAPLIVDITELDVQAGSIEHDNGLCLDSETPAVFILSCGPTMTPCETGTDYQWTVTPHQAGSVVDGQGTAEAGIRFHLIEDFTQPITVTVDYEICGEPFSVTTEPIIFETVGEASLEVFPVATCTNDQALFTVTPNSTLDVSNIDWVLTDQAGQVFTHNGPGLTWDFAPLPTQPLPSFGPANVVATIQYADCLLEEVVYGSIQYLYNPGIEISTVYHGERCDRDVALPVDVTFYASQSSSASEGYYEWFRVCPDGDSTTSTLIGAGDNLSSLTDHIDPDAECGYVLTLTRTYTIDGEEFTCSRDILVPLDYDCASSGCEGLCPEITVVNPGPIGVNSKPPGVIEAYVETKDSVKTGVCTFFDPRNDPAIILSGATFGTRVSTVNLEEGFTRGEIADFTNEFITFSTFTNPGVYELYFFAEGTYLGDYICGETTKLVEIPYIPHMDYALECGEGSQEGEYLLRVEDLTEVVFENQIAQGDYNWEVRLAASGAVLASGGDNTEVFAINQPAVATEVQICMSPQATFMHPDVTPGEPYQVEYCESLILPARATAEFSVNQMNPTICENTPFLFELVGNVDPSSTYHWDFGDNSSSMLAEPIKEFAMPGTYTVTLTAMNSLGCRVSTEQVITVTSSEFEGDLVATPNACNSQALVEFIPDPQEPGTAPYTYTWQPGPSNTPQIILGTDAFVQLHVEDAAGCQFEVSQSVDVDPALLLPLNVPEAQYCANEVVTYTVLAPASTAFTYQLVLNGTVIDNQLQPTQTILRTLDLTDPAVSSLLNVSGAANRLSVVVLDGTFVCQESTEEFAVLEVPEPPVITSILECDPSQVLFLTLNGAEVDWYLSGTLALRGSSQFLVPASTAASFVTARASNVQECSSDPSNGVFVPGLTLPNILTGCILDCENLPSVLSAGTFSQFSSWSWQFISSSGTTPAGCNPPSGTNSRVEDWVDYLNCGNGEYSLMVEYALPSGESCEINVEGFCVECVPASCTGPILIAENTVCRYGENPDMQYFYLNFHTTNPEPGDAELCGNNPVRISNADFITDPIITLEGGDSYNVEVLVAVQDSINPSEACMTLSFCNSGSDIVCYETTACLGSGPKGLEGECGNVSCGGEVTYDVDATSALCTNNPVTIHLKGVELQLPLGCDSIHQVQMWTETGVLSNFAAGGPQWNLNYTKNGTVIEVGDMQFDYTRYTDHREACFRFDIKCLDADGNNTLCSSSLCVDLAEECNNFITNPHPGETYVYCEGSDEVYSYYSIEHYFDQELEFQDHLVAVYGGELQEELQYIEGGFVSYARIPLGNHHFLMHFGNPEVDRESDLYTFPEYGEGEWGYLRSEQDYFLPVHLDECASGELEQRSKRARATQDDAMRDALTVTLTPNPATDAVSVTIHGLARTERIAWSDISVHTLSGQQFHVELGATASNRATIHVDALPSGLYSVKTTTDHGRSVLTRFVKL